MVHILSSKPSSGFKGLDFCISQGKHRMIQLYRAEKHTLRQSFGLASTRPLSSYKSRLLLPFHYRKKTKGYCSRTSFEGCLVFGFRSGWCSDIPNRSGFQLRNSFFRALYSVRMRLLVFVWVIPWVDRPHERS